ncbi:MAG: hypothetical protein IKN10_07990 [Muribaculaceae bacterium]|nr:hypothetical protein [Muribaculaceae bacterium]
MSFWQDKAAAGFGKRKRPAVTASLYSQKALPYEKNYYLQIIGAKVLPNEFTAPKFFIKKG